MENTIIKNPTITEEQYNTLKDNLGTINTKVRLSSCEVAGIVATIRDSRAYQYEGYGITEFGKYAEEVLGYRKGAISQMKSVTDMFGIVDKSGNVTVDPRVAEYGVEKLYRISRHPVLQALDDEADSVAVFNQIEDALGLCPSMRTTDLKDIIAIAQGKQPKALEDKDSSVDQTSEETPSAEATSAEATSEVSATKEEVVTLQELINRFVGYAKDNKMSDKEFRKAFIKEFDK